MSDELYEEEIGKLCAANAELRERLAASESALLLENSTLCAWCGRNVDDAFRARVAEEFAALRAGWCLLMGDADRDRDRLRIAQIANEIDAAAKRLGLEVKE